MNCTAYQTLLGNQVKKNDKGGALDTYGRQERCINGLDAKT